MDGNTKTLIIHPVSVVLVFPVGDKFVLLSKAGMFSVTSFDEIVGTIGQAITDNAPGRGYNRVTNVELATCCFNIETAELDFVKLRTVQDFVNLANGDTVVAWFQPKISVFVGRCRWCVVSLLRRHRNGQRWKEWIVGGDEIIAGSILKNR
jgi:hypothetical protein